MKSPVLTASVVCAVLTIGTAHAGPKLIIPETHFDFGHSPQHVRISHTFWLKAAGDSDLKIVKVNPGCSCTQAPIEKYDLAVGDSTRLEIIFDTRAYRAHVEKHPSITTNEGPEARHLYITVDPEPRPDSTYPVVIAPYKLSLSPLTDRPDTGIDFTIRNVSDQPLTLTVIASEDEFFRVSLPREIAPGAAAPARVELAGTAPDESFQKSFTFELNDSARTRFTVPVRRMVRDNRPEQSGASDRTADNP